MLLPRSKIDAIQPDKLSSMLVDIDDAIDEGTRHLRETGEIPDTDDVHMINRIEDTFNDSPEFCVKFGKLAVAMTRAGFTSQAVAVSLVARGVFLGWRAAVQHAEALQLESLFKEEQQITTLPKLTPSQILDLAAYIEKRRVFMAGYTDDLASHACRFVGMPAPYPDTIRIAKQLLPESWLHICHWPPAWQDAWWIHGRRGEEAKCLALFLEEHADTVAE